MSERGLKASFYGLGVISGLIACIAAFSIWSGWLRKGGTSERSAMGAATVLKAAHNLDPEHPVHQAMIYLKERLDLYSGGTMRLDIYPASQLGSPTECVEQMQSGTLDMSVVSASPLEGFIPEIGVFSLPYVFRNRRHFWSVLDSRIGREVLELGVDRRLRGVCFFDAGSRNFYTRRRPIREPEDLSGLKIRVMNSRTAMEMIHTMGGSPTPIAWEELYTALQQGTVDGAENNLPSFYSSRHFEVCRFFTTDAHTRIPDLVIVSEWTWERLNAQQRAWLTAAARDASQFQREVWEEASAEALEAMKKAGVEIISPDKAAFEDAVRPMLEKYSQGRSGALLRRIMEMGEP